MCVVSLQSFKGLKENTFVFFSAGVDFGLKAELRVWRSIQLEYIFIAVCLVFMHVVKHRLSALRICIFYERTAGGFNQLAGFNSKSEGKLVVSFQSSL